MKRDKKFSMDSVKFIDDILTEDERLNLLNLSKPLLEIIPFSPGLQTHHRLHTKCPVISSLVEKIAKKSGFNRVIKKSWVNYTDRDLAYEMYHTHHDSFYTTIVYMIENPEGIGTFFKIGEKIYSTKCPTNSAMLFPTTMEHTVPPNVTMPRYSLAIDFF